ncbi:MAG: YchJ family protein [Kangiellaceae bacterium]|jgi:SEC-C motif-containing protein|nr:YchJ family protein [Kangiellaceae bacterium]
MRHCYCGSGDKYSDCCERFISGVDLPNTAEQLMRSRFSAFCLADGDYLFKTHDPTTRAGLSVSELTASAEQSPWIKLDLLNHIEIDADHATVEFIAYQLLGDYLLPHHEVSYFTFRDRQWLYSKGEFPILRQGGKIKLKRNDSCPCGSGLKFKRCCRSSG